MGFLKKELKELGRDFCKGLRMGFKPGKVVKMPKKPKVGNFKNVGF